MTSEEMLAILIETMAIEVVLLRSIISDLAELSADGYICHEAGWCNLCGASVLMRQAEPHKDDCPYQRAVDYVHR